MYIAIWYVCNGAHVCTMWCAMVHIYVVCNGEIGRQQGDKTGMVDGADTYLSLCWPL